MNHKKRPIRLLTGDDESETDRVSGGAAPDNPLANANVSKKVAIIIIAASFSITAISSVLFVVRALTLSSRDLIIIDQSSSSSQGSRSENAFQFNLLFATNIRQVPDLYDGVVGDTLICFLNLYSHAILIIPGRALHFELTPAYRTLDL